MGSVGELADRTPATRERYVDFLRALAITAVVLGHWLVSAVVRDDQGNLTGHSALESMPWAYPITWVVQVMPVFFIVGGYANAASLASHRRRGGGAITWLQDRSGRLVRPATALIVVLAAAALLARALGAEPGFIRLVVWIASISLWFLATYLVVVVATPVMDRLHRRFGWWVVAVLVLLVAVGDGARLAGHEPLAVGGFLFGWLAIHQLGFFWRDGRLSSRPAVVGPLLFGGLAALILLTTIGPYSVSMVDVAGQRLRNTSPPTVALLAATAFQLGLIMLAREPARRWLNRPRPWRVVVAMNAFVFTIFLWHMVAVIVLFGVLDAVHQAPTPVAATGRWWLWRVPVLLGSLVVLAALVAIFGRVETSRHRPKPPPAWLRRVIGGRVTGAVLTIAAFVAVVYGLVANSVAPNRGDFLAGLPTAGLLAYLAGALVLRLQRGGPAPGRR